MRKMFAGLAVALMLALSSMAYAEEGPYLWSPEGDIIIPPDLDGGGGGDTTPGGGGGGGSKGSPGDGYGEKSPKTGDINILFVEGLGGVAAVTAIVTRKKRHA